MAAKVQQVGTSNDTKTIVTVLLLIFVFPVGFILMWVWTNWPKWVKWIVTLPIILVILGLIASTILVATNPITQRDAACVNACNGGKDTTCYSACMDKGKSNTENNNEITPGTIQEY